jgi:hypothetical protein
MDLALHQRAMLALVRGDCRSASDSDPYVGQVARSPDLEEARRNILLWRIYVLERTCVLTVALLRWQELLESTVDAFISQTNISPFREFQPRIFLEFLNDHADPLLKSVARFERALMKVREGDQSTFVISWTCEPRRILKALAEGHPLDDQLIPGSYTSTVSRSLPHLFETSPA